MFALASALVGVIPDGVLAVPGRARCQPTAYVTNARSDSVSTVDVKTRKHPADITLGDNPHSMAFTPNGKAALVTNLQDRTVSVIDVKTRTEQFPRINVGALPFGVAITPNGKTRLRRQRWQRHGVDD
jgi:large repetitive protein